MNKKRVLIIVLVLTIIIIIFQNIISLNTVYFGNYTSVVVIGKKMIKKDNSKNIILKKVNIYDDGNIINGFMKSKKEDVGYKYYYVSSENEIINKIDMISSGLMIKLDMPLSDNVDTSRDEKAVSEVNNLFDLNITKKELYDYKKITYDIDNDSKEEKIVYAKYAVEDKIKNSIVIDDGSIVNVLEYDYPNDKESHKRIYLSNVVDINNDKNYEIIVAKIDGDSQPTYYDIYSYENGKVKEIK